MMTLTALALVLGYVLTVVCSLIATFGITTAFPHFVAKEHRLTSAYKRMYALVWMLSATVGGFAAVATASVGGISPWLIGVALTLMLTGMLWYNSWEARQRGTAHQILISLTTAIGVAAGAWLAVHFVKLQF
jgi:O-antigen/teichoic acid export membrane protein